jgi:transcriptional regulator with XRE-family HTH domain
MNPVAVPVNPKRIKDARLAKNMTQDALARAIETGVSNVARWEAGKHSPRVEFVAAIAEATDKPMEFFFGSEEEDGSDEDDEEAAAMADLAESLQRILKAELKRVRKGVAVGERL